MAGSSSGYIFLGCDSWISDGGFVDNIHSLVDMTTAEQNDLIEGIIGTTPYRFVLYVSHEVIINALPFFETLSFYEIMNVGVHQYIIKSTRSVISDPYIYKK